MQWERILEAAPWGVRAMPRGAVMDGYFYVVSGRKGMFKIYSDTWRTADGVSWECMSRKAGWGKRCYPDVDVVDGDLVLTGGQSLLTFYNDVWRSADQGRSWEQVCAEAPWAPRAGHHSHVIDGDIYLFGGGQNSFGRILYPELWVSKDKGETWELRCQLPEDMGRAGMQVVHIDGTIYFMGGDHDNPVIQANWPGRRNDVWKSDDKGATWELLGQAPWVPRTGHQGVAHNGKVFIIGGHIQGPDPKAKRQYLAHDCWMWEPKACGESMTGWQLLTDNVWGCADNPGRDGKSDFMLEVRDDKLWTFGGDREVMSPWPQDNDVWIADIADV
jgi:hypothetical protein